MTAQRIHRIAVLVTILTAATNALLAAVGVITPGAAVTLWLAVEVPLFVLVAALTARQVRSLRRSGTTWRAVLDTVAGRAVAGLIRGEVRAYRSLWLLVRRRRDGICDGVAGIGYARGAMGIPIAFLVACIVETAVIHLLVSWPWLRTTLLIVSVYTFVPLGGMLAARIVHPHLLDDTRFTLRSGHQVVAVIDRGNIVKVLLHRNFRNIDPIIDGIALYLPGPDGTNVDVLVRDPVEVTLPHLFERRRVTGSVERISLQVDDPEALRAALAATRSGTGANSVG
ncbi:MAG: hypothetical protein WAX14_16600 [Rhodococcus sp. (in: high G+C Gram-positive bacteria)]|uniref:hypothetical protein n=1 Tax=Rhodococcus sp. TaxID=1831 RepID=UPI003BB68846